MEALTDESGAGFGNPTGTTCYLAACIQLMYAVPEWRTLATRFNAANIGNLPRDQLLVRFSTLLQVSTPSFPWLGSPFFSISLFRNWTLVFAPSKQC